MVIAVLPGAGRQACRRCGRLNARSSARIEARMLRQVSTATTTDKSERVAEANSSSSSGKGEPGAMSRRLQEATEEVLLSGGRAGQRAVEDSGFSDELKEKLLDKIAGAKFRKQYSGAFSQAGLTSAAGEGTRYTAAAQPWSGQESTEDAVLRMLDDAKKPLKPEDRGKFQTPVVDPRIRLGGPRQSAGQKVASARDKANMYVGMDLKARKGLSDEEREEMKRGFRERFEPGARSMPITVSGVAALANERIEDAIARGKFKDIPRGKQVKRDARADNPFIDTTEYIMNKMIQRQEIVPPWIEKQQDVAKQTRIFRERLRNDWKRHAARMIAAQGGSMEEQMKRAVSFAEAEAAHDPKSRSTNQVAMPSYASDSPVMQKLGQKAPGLVDEAKPESASPALGAVGPVFRDPTWEKAEHSYMKLSVDNLNSMTRSYNLMAPELAKKPYFSLERELASCYADVAPLIANEIKLRATAGVSVSRPVGPHVREASSLISHLRGGDTAKIHLEADEKIYGLKEWWRDFWKRL